MPRERRLHSLKHNKTTTLSNEFIFFDTETKGEKISDNAEEHTLWFGCARFLRLRNDSAEGTREDFVFYEPSEFWDWLDGKARLRQRIWLFAHNTAYDFRVVKGFTTLPLRGWTMRRPIFDHGRFLVTWRKGRTTLTFSDTMNYFPMALQKLGESMGEHKLPMPPKEAPFETWLYYCWQDVNVIEKTILSLREFIGSEDLGTWGVTSARQAMNAYTHRFMKHKIFVHSIESASELELACYHGGRVEAFRLGEIPWSPVYKLDVNSMYPYVMALNEYPRAVMDYVAGVPPRALEPYMERYSVLGLCQLETDEPVYATYINKKLCFPVGRFPCFLTHGEIEYALERGHLKRLIEGYYYEKAPLFSEFVSYFYDKRQQYGKEGNLPFQLFCKMVMNSLYGKFGQRVPASEVVGDADPSVMKIVQVFDVETGESWKEITIGGLVYKEGERTLSFNSFPAISATVTGYARVFLWRLCKQAGRNNVGYCDTDSLLVSPEGYERLQPLIDPQRLGALKVESIADHASIQGLKDYTVGDVRHIKGVRPTDIEVRPGVFETQQVPGIRNGLWKGDAEKVVFIRLLKHLTRDYDKGTVNADRTISPFVLNEGA